MMLRALILVLASVGQSAVALSCLEPSVSRAYLDAKASEATYMIGLGRFSFPEGALAPLPVSRDPGVERTVSATFAGHLFSGRGFDFETTLDVEITARCFGPWCASFAPEIDVIAFLEERETGFALTVTPCGGSAFAEPTREQIAQILACHEGKACAPPDDL